MFEIVGSRLRVYHSSARSKLADFPDDLSVLGAGMLAEALEIGASEQGLAVQLTCAVLERTDDVPWIDAEFRPVDMPPDPLCSAMMARHTDRRRFAGGSADDPVFAELAAMAQAYEGARLSVVPPTVGAFQQQLAIADEITMEWPELRRDLNRWLRFTRSEVRRTGDGMPWRSLLRGPERRRHLLQSRVWMAQARLDWFPAWWTTIESRLFDDSGELTPRDLSDCAAVGCVATQSSEPEDLLAAGRMVFRAWLTLTARGYGLQPMTNLTSILYGRRANEWNLPSAFADRLDEADRVVADTFGLAPDALPVFAFRTGLASGPCRPEASTRRRAQHVRWLE